MKKLISLTIAIILLLAVVAACSRYVPFVRDNPGQTTSCSYISVPSTNPQRETNPPRETDPIPLPPTPPIVPTLPNRFTWHIEPTLWFEHGLWHWQGIFYTGWVYISGIGEFPAIQVDPYTGELKDTFHITSSWSRLETWIHCSQNDLFFLGNGWDGYIVYTREDFYDFFYDSAFYHMIHQYDSLTIYGNPCIYTNIIDLDFGNMIGSALFRGNLQVTEFVFCFASFQNMFSAQNWRPLNMFLVRLQETNLFGIINSDGEIVLPFIFEYIHFIREGGIFVRYQEFWGVINVDDKFVYEPFLAGPQCCCDFHQYPYTWRITP